jgi:cobalt-zinc-cadmium efflux system membrane fusion protein
MKGKTPFIISIVIGIGIVLGWFILQTETPMVVQESGKQAKRPQAETSKNGNQVKESQIGTGTLKNSNQAEETQTETGAHEENHIKITPEAQQNAGIKVRMAGPVQLKTLLKLPGEIQFNQNLLAHVVPRVEGVVVAVYKQLGEPVEKGELIAVLESRELADLKSQYYTAIKRRDLAQLTFDREERLWKDNISAEQDYLTAKTALAEAKITVTTAAQRLIALGLSPGKLNTGAKENGSKLSRYPIRAPFKGRVIRMHIVRGEAVKADAELFMIADLSTVWGIITVYAENLNQVRIGQKVTVKSNELAMKATGTISYVGYLIDPQTRSTEAQVDIPNPEERWLPGLFVTVEVAKKETPVPVAVTSGAIQTYQDKSIVFVQQGNGFEVRAVTLGRRDKQWIEVATGLSAGEYYAAENSFVLKSELDKSATHLQYPQ